MAFQRDDICVALGDLGEALFRSRVGERAAHAHVDGRDRADADGGEHEGHGDSDSTAKAATSPASRRSAVLGTMARKKISDVPKNPRGHPRG